MKGSSVALGIIGSGPSALYLLRHIDGNLDKVAKKIRSISIFEQSEIMGCGMPYSPETTDRYNLSNITSPELPSLPETLVQWLSRQSDDTLSRYGIPREEIGDDGIYPRLVLGEYFRTQYVTLVDSLRSRGVEIEEWPNTVITDIVDRPGNGSVTAVSGTGSRHTFERIVVATGHTWPDEDCPEHGFFASPWPIGKLLPEEGTRTNCKVGTLGASLSAFDVVTSLAHRHGQFVAEGGGLAYRPDPDTEAFTLVMHDANGWLPHLQYEQAEPLREIYRHTDRESLFALRDSKGFLPLDTYFHEVCKPALRRAFLEDGREDLAEALSDRRFGIDEFVEKMEEEHEYADAFDGMKKELTEAKRDAAKDRPAHWKEITDDLMYTLNFHAELMPAEDHLHFHKKVIPFLMNVIAAIPISSARILLALRAAGKIDLVPGRVEPDLPNSPAGKTRVKVEDEGEESESEYGLFVVCGGQKGMEIEDYPFRSLVDQGTVRSAGVEFANSGSVGSADEDELLERGKRPQYNVGGIDITPDYRVVGSDGESNPRIVDIAPPHIAGLRPYSYGLQACDCAAGIVVRSWTDESS